MFANGKSILVQPIQRDDLLVNAIDCRLIDVQQKITDLLNDGYVIYDVASATNNGFYNLIASSSGNRICVWKSAGSSNYTVYSSELASNGNNVVINATINNMNQVTQIRDCGIAAASSGIYLANKVEFYGGVWRASWNYGGNSFKFTNCDIITPGYFTGVNVQFDYCNFFANGSVYLPYTAYVNNVDTNYILGSTVYGSTVLFMWMKTSYTTSSDWLTRCTFTDWKNNLGVSIYSTTPNMIFNFDSIKLEDSNLQMTNVYTTNGSKIYYEGQDITLTVGGTTIDWRQIGSVNVSSSSGLSPSLAINQSGIPYIAYQDNSTDSVGKASCMKYGSSGWGPVGYVAFSSVALSGVQLCLSTDSDVVVIGKTTGNNVCSYYYSAAASSWNLLGSAGFSTGNISLLSAAYSYAQSSSAVYAKYIYATVTNTSASPYINNYIYNISDSSGWTLARLQYLESSSKASIPTGLTRNKFAAYTINSTGNIDSWDQYISSVGSTSFIYNDSGMTTQSGLLSVKCNPEGIWQTQLFAVVGATSGVTAYGRIQTNSTLIGYANFSTATVSNISCGIINSYYYVVCQETTNSKASCYRYNSASSTWSVLGSGNFSTETINTLNMQSYNDKPYVAVEEKAAPGINLYGYIDLGNDSIVNYTFEYLEDDLVDGEKSLPITTIQSTANYLVQNCKVRPVYNMVNTVIGRYIRNSYNIELTNSLNSPVDETLKETNADTFWIVKREDIEDDLDGKIIKNLKLYDATLAAYTYRSNDNFMIIANSVTKGDAVFCFYNNKIRATIFSDNYLDASYTITDCFILMEVDEISDLVNVVSSTTLEDCPLETGSITFNSYDNEICA